MCKASLKQEFSEAPPMSIGLHIEPSLKARLKLFTTDTNVPEMIGLG